MTGKNFVTRSLDIRKIVHAQKSPNASWVHAT